MENKRKQVEVVINGRIYKLGTNDSEEYIKSVASYVDRKYREIVEKTDSITRLSEYFPIMLSLNIADDLFKRARDAGGSAPKKREAVMTEEDRNLEAQLREAGKTIRQKDIQLKELEGIKARAEELEKLLEKKEGSVSGVFKLKLDKAEKTLEETRERLSKTEKELEAAETAAAEAESLRAELATVKAELAEKASAAADAEVKLSEETEKTKELGEKLDEIKEELSQKEATVTETEGKLKAMEAALSASKVDAQNREAAEKELSDKKAELERALMNAEDKLRNITAELRETDKKSVENFSRFVEAQERIKTLEGQLKEIKSDHDRLETSEKELKDRLEKSENVLEEIKKSKDEEINSLRTENKRLGNIVADAGLMGPSHDRKGKAKDKYKDRDTLLKEINDIKSEFGRAKKANAQLMEEIKRLKGEE